MMEQQIQEYAKKNREPQWLLQKRLDAYAKVKSMPSSLFKYGLHIITTFSTEGAQLFTDTAPLTIKEKSSSITARPFANANQALLKEFLMSSYVTENRLIAANAAFFTSSLLIHIPKNAENQTIHITHSEHATEFSYILVIAEESSSAIIIDDLSNNPEISSATVEIIAKENAQVRYATAQKGNVKKSYAFRTAKIGRNANVEWLEILTGPNTAKSETVSNLAGEGARTSVFSIFFGSNTQQFDITAKCNHLAPHTESTMLCRGVLKHSARAIQQGFAKIHRDAPGSSAHQKARILLLSKSARATPIPRLDIDNNDVQATHEAAVGQIDAEKIFYMMSRGIPEQDAKKSYVEGFFAPYVQKLAIEQLQSDVEAVIAKRMEQ
jgi:FeS assembly protein SufD